MINGYRPIHYHILITYPYPLAEPFHTHIWVGIELIQRALVTESYFLEPLNEP